MTQLRQTIRLAIAAGVALGLSHYLQWNENYWIVISALLGLQMSSPPLLRQREFFLVLIALLTSISAAFAYFISSSVFLLAFFLFFTTFMTITVGMRWPVYWGGAFLINFFATLSSGFPTDMTGIKQRIMSILLGFGIAVLLQKLFFPNRLRDDARFILAQALQDLIELNQAIFNCYLSADYPAHQFEYAKKIHQKRRDFSFVICVAGAMVEKIKKNKGPLQKILYAIEELYEVIQSLGTLLYRVEDHTTFQIIYKELLALSDNILTDLRALKIYLLKSVSGPPSQEALKETIFQLEEVNHSTVSIVARDPMVFLLFIQDLFSLQKAMLELTHDITVAGVKS